MKALTKPSLNGQTIIWEVSCANFSIRLRTQITLSHVDEAYAAATRSGVTPYSPTILAILGSPLSVEYLDPEYSVNLPKVRSILIMLLPEGGSV
jgi:hypothetical protein